MRPSHATRWRWFLAHIATLVAVALLARPAAAEFPVLQITTHPVSASSVWVRRDGEPQYVHYADHTPIGLELSPGTYDVRVEARDGLFYVYHGERTRLTPGFDRPTIEMTRDVDWASVVEVGGVLAFLLLGGITFLWLRSRNTHARYVAAVRRARQTVADPDFTDLHLELPPVLGVVLETGTGRAFSMDSEIGRGGMGAVFEASSIPPDGQQYAVKLLFERPDMDRIISRFTREIRLCAQLNHPNIVQVVDWGVYESNSGKSWPFMVMEKVVGISLRSALANSPGGAIEVKQAVGWAIEILRAVRAAHQHKIVHRDLKPDNIMIASSGHIKVMDFGIAFQVGHNDLTVSGQALGTPVYMSPEHLNAKTTTASSDLYSVGVILYEMLSGGYPHEGKELWALMAQKLADPPRPIRQVCPDLDPDLAAAIMKLISSRPSERFANADEVLHYLEQWLSAHGGLAE